MSDGGKVDDEAKRLACELREAYQDESEWAPETVDAETDVRLRAAEFLERAAQGSDLVMQRLVEALERAEKAEARARDWQEDCQAWAESARWNSEQATEQAKRAEQAEADAERYRHLKSIALPHYAWDRHEGAMWHMSVHDPKDKGLNAAIDTAREGR